MTASAVPPTTHSGGWLNLWANPIAQRCRRARLRGRHLVTYGVLGFTITSFVFLVTYLWPVYNLEASHEAAAKSAVMPMLLIQGVVMMGMGTMALATGIARERDRDLLDYQRMTPMPPTTKILGYLFGLPAREYFLFALTLPFVVYSVWVAGIPLLKVGKFYAVFFTAVWMYHMTGLCAGMVSKKPWQSAVVSLGMVVLLYLVLPQLSAVGLWFIEYLTVYPTFFSLIAEELQGSRSGDIPPWLLEVYEDVRFFGFAVNPMLFSLLLQGGMLATLFIVVRRKWVDPGWHCFSKPFGLLFVAVVHLVLVGTLWPTLREPVLLRRVLDELNAPYAPQALGWMLGLFLGISAAAVGLTVYLVTPSRHTARRGFRRARKNGRRATPAWWDAAPALSWAVALLAVAALGYAAVIAAARPNALLFGEAARWPWLLAPLALMVPAALLFHGLAERLPTRGLLLAAFGLWVFPVMVGVIVGIVSRDGLPVLYLGSPSPAVAGVLALISLTYHTGIDAPGWDAGFRSQVLPHVPTILVLCLGINGFLALAVQVNRVGWLRRWRGEEVQRENTASDQGASAPVAS